MLTQHLLRARGFLRLEALQWTQALFKSHPCLLPWEWFSSEPSSSATECRQYNLPKRWLWKLWPCWHVFSGGPRRGPGALSKCWCLNPAPTSLSSTSSFHYHWICFRWGDSTFHSCLGASTAPLPLKEQRLVVGSWSLLLVRSHLNPAFILRQELWPQHTPELSFTLKSEGFDGKRIGLNCGQLLLLAQLLYCL